nr:uncharacterized protein LOC109747388 [Aegilops tauschii subsp. strangulata]
MADAGGERPDWGADLVEQARQVAAGTFKVEAGSGEAHEVEKVEKVEAGSGEEQAEQKQEEEDLVGNKRKWDKTGFYPYDSDEAEPYEYESGDDVVEGNVESFEEKVVLKIRAQGPGMYHNWRTEKYRCPFCSKPKPSKFMAKANGKKGATIDKDEEVMSGKCKRTIPKKFESPYALDKPSRRPNRGQKPSGTSTATRALFSENHEPEVVADELTPEIVDAAVSFVELAASTEKNKGKKVYYSEGRGISLTSERIRPVIDAYMGHLELRVSHDRYLYPAWMSKFLVDRAIGRDDPLPSSCNMDSALSKAGAVNRVTKEYTVRDKMYIALNIDNAHWMTVVMHLIKQEFQVLDSLYPLDLIEKTVKALRMAIAHDMHLANLITPGKYPDVSKWPIKEYDMPQQEDGNSCGLFVTECLEHWDGDRMTRDFSQATVDARRRRFVTELIMSPSNTMECVKNKIREIARKRRT